MGKGGKAKKKKFAYLKNFLYFCSRNVIFYKTHMKKRILGLLFLLICCTNYLAAQVDTEFWFAAPYFNCEHGMYAPYRLVIFSFDEEATITVSMPANPAFTPIVRTIGANSYTEIVLANDKLEGDASITTPFNTITQRGLLITSTGKIQERGVFRLRYCHL